MGNCIFIDCRFVFVLCFLVSGCVLIHFNQGKKNCMVQCSTFRCATKHFHFELETSTFKSNEKKVTANECLQLPQIRVKIRY